MSRDEGWGGGVVNLVTAWKKNHSQQIDYEHFMIGDRIGRGVLSVRYIVPLMDALRLLVVTLRGRYGLVHINPSFNARALLRDGLFMFVLRASRLRTFVFFHGWDDALSARVVRNTLLRFLVRNTFGRAAIIMVLAESFRQQLISMGVDERKIHATTTMFDGEDMRPLNRERIAPGQRILFLSRFIREKGMFELLEAFARIVKEFPDARLILAGDGPARDELVQAVRAAGLSGSVELPGYLRGEDKARVLAAADIFVLPTYYGEGCPVSLLEAMAAGLALISTPVGGIPDVLEDGENGVLLPSADPELIYQALHKLLSSPQDLIRISNINREKAWRCYEASVVTAQIEAYYKQAVGLPT